MQKTTMAQIIPLVGDCSEASELVPKGYYSFKNSPQGHGKKLEISGNSHVSPYYFQRETHTAWFKFDALTNGLLTFKILPTDTSADFDFLLFRYTDGDFCSDITSKKIKPERSNISRNNPSEQSITGLSVGAEDKYVRSGPGNHLSKSIKVEKGDRFYLVLNNVYGTETDFRISFAYYSIIEVQGVVNDEESGKAVGGATISWEEKTGEVLAETTSDMETGSFKFNVPVKKGKKPQEYILATSEDKHFFSEQTIRASRDTIPKSINVILPQLKKGGKMVLKNINFYGNLPVPLPSSKPSFKRIYKLMKANKSLRIRIEGHTNGCDNGIAFVQKLSDDRAIMVKKYLTDKGIQEDRIKTFGFGCVRMLFPEMRTEEEQRQNRRVEIVVLSY